MVFRTSDIYMELKMKKGLLITVSLVLFAAVSFSAFASGTKQESGPRIVVASKIDTEGALLGSMIVLMLDANGFEAVDKTEFGTTDVIRTAIKNGEIDIYPEYTGNGAFFHSDSPQDVWKVAKDAYETIKKWDYDKHQLVWLQPAPANNTWAIAIRMDVAEKAGLKTLSDFGKYVSSGGDVKIAASEEFASRPDALPAFEEAYGFKLEKNQMLLLSGGNTATTEKAAAENTDGVNTAMAYGTDGQLAALGLLVLEDDLHVQPVYEPAPLVREEIYKANPQIETILAPVFKSLDLVTLQSLNSMIAVEGRSAKEVAKEYLEKNAFLK